MKYITTLVSKKRTKEKMKSDEQEILEMKYKLTNASNGKALKTIALETAYSDLKKDIKDFRKKMNDLLDDLEKQSMTELDYLKKTLSDQLDERSQACNRLRHAIDSLTKKLHKANMDDTRRFIWLHQSHDILVESKKAVAENYPM